MKSNLFGRAIAFALLLAAWTAPAQAEWRRAESPNFILYGEVGESDLRRRILQLEDFDWLMRLMTGVSEPPAPSKLHIFLVGGNAALNVVHQMPAGIDGFYTATPEGIAAVVDVRTAPGNELLFHEYAHHFMRQYRPNAYPGWYSEGFADYFSTARITPRQIDIGTASPGRAYTITQSQWLPLEQVLHGQPMSFGSRDAMGRFYAQSWLIVHYFHSTPERQQALGRYLATARSDPRGALQAATGMDQAAFTAELRRYIRGGHISYRRLTRENPTPPAVTVTVLPRGANDLMLYHAALRIGIEEARAPDYLQRIRAAAARHPDDPFARRVLAHAELNFGDRAVADRLLDSLLAAAPNDAELMYLKGMRHLLAAEAAEDFEPEARIARTWFSRAHRADEHHFQTLFRYAQSLRAEPNYVSENTSNVLLLARQLAPQVSAITVNAAAMLMNLGHHEEAILLLRPLAADPHNASLASVARGMIDRASAGDRTPVTILPGPPPGERGAPAN